MFVTLQASIFFCLFVLFLHLANFFIIFDFLQFECDMPRGVCVCVCVCVCVYVYVYTYIYTYIYLAQCSLNFWNCCLISDINAKNSQSFLIQTLFLFLSFFFLCYFHCTYVLLFLVIPSLCIFYSDVFFFFPNLFFFLVLEVSINMFWSSEILFSVVEISLKSFFICVIVFFISSLKIIFLEILSFCLHFPLACLTYLL